jgi:hypothetical protein
MLFDGLAECPWSCGPGLEETHPQEIGNIFVAAESHTFQKIEDPPSCIIRSPVGQLLLLVAAPISVRFGRVEKSGKINKIFRGRSKVGDEPTCPSMSSSREPELPHLPLASLSTVVIRTMLINKPCADDVTLCYTQFRSPSRRAS